VGRSYNGLFFSAKGGKDDMGEKKEVRIFFLDFATATAQPKSKIDFNSCTKKGGNARCRCYSHKKVAEISTNMAFKWHESLAWRDFFLFFQLTNLDP